jgi:hypothetical protein
MKQPEEAPVGRRKTLLKRTSRKSDRSEPKPQNKTNPDRDEENLVKIFEER